MPVMFIVGICFVLLLLRIIYLFVDMFRHRLTPRYTFLRYLPRSLIVKTPVPKVDDGLCAELCKKTEQIEGQGQVEG